MPRPTTPPSTTRGLPLTGWLTLLLTAAISAIWSAHKLLEQDEIFSLQTDRVASLAEVLRIQRLYPISLEPPPYHVLAHAAMAVFGPTAFALRLPAFAGYLLMQLCLYFIVRDLISTHHDNAVAQRAGVIAMAIPALTWTLYYAAEGRPYGLLLGSYALAVLCWQQATRVSEPLPNAIRKGTNFSPALKGTGFSPYVEDPINLGALAPEGNSRILPLIGLTLALALTLNVHFYGVLLLIPLCAAELLRTLQRRRIDWPLAAALTAGTATILFTLPYVNSSAEFKQHYYAGPVSAHMLTQPYRQMLLNYTTFPHAVQTACILLLTLAAAAVLIRCWRILRSQTLAATPPELLIILLLTLMPVFAFVLGKFVTHALEVRHSIGAIIGIVTLIAIALTPSLHTKRSFYALLTALLLAAILINTNRTRASADEARTLLATLTLTPAQQAALAANPDPNLYFQDLGQWETASLYTPDPALRAHLVLVYSRTEEMRFEQHDTMYLTATHTQRFSPQPIVSYDALRQSPGDHLFITYHSGWNWTQQAFATEATSVHPMGQAFGGQLDAVRFKQ